MTSVRSFVALSSLGLFTLHAAAFEKIWRCGQEFTDRPDAVSGKECHILKNNRITLQASLTIPLVAQRTRDTAARSILEMELRQAEQRQSELSRQSVKSPNLQAAIMRTQGDIAGLRREIERVR
jgi:hypothetical protein